MTIDGREAMECDKIDIVRAIDEDEAIYRLRLQYEERPSRWLSDIEVQSLDNIAFDVIDVH
jgi:hypothetical protein